MQPATRTITVLATIALVLAITHVAQADPPTTWHFSLQTQGQNVYWTSPTAVYNAAGLYGMSYQITQVIVTVRWLIFDIDVDVTDQIPPENLSNSGVFPGPPPIVLADDDFVYPEPPEEPGVAAHVKLWLDAGGYGRAEITEVYLGQIYVEPYGMVTVKKIAVTGDVTVQPFRYGDLNCDGLVDGFDIQPFVLALTDPGGYAAAHPNCDASLADINADSAVDGFDIQPFVELLVGT